MKTQKTKNQKNASKAFIDRKDNLLENVEISEDVKLTNIVLVNDRELRVLNSIKELETAMHSDCITIEVSRVTPIGGKPLYINKINILYFEEWNL